MDGSDTNTGAGLPDPDVAAHPLRAFDARCPPAERRGNLGETNFTENIFLLQFVLEMTRDRPINTELNSEWSRIVFFDIENPNISPQVLPQNSLSSSRNDRLGSDNEPLVEENLVNANLVNASFSRSSALILTILDSISRGLRARNLVFETSWPKSV